MAFIFFYLFVHNLFITDTNIYNLSLFLTPFKKFTTLTLDKDTGRSKGFAFVEMGTEDAGIAAIAGLNETDFDGQTIVCKKAEPRPQSFNRDNNFRPRERRY